MDDDQVREELVGFIVDNFLFGDVSQLPGDEASLAERGIVDSTGILELIEFLETRFSINVDEAETVPENLGSVAGIVRYVKSVSGRSSQESRRDS